MWRHRHGPRADLNTGTFNRRVVHPCRDRAPRSVAAAEMPSNGRPVTVTEREGPDGPDQHQDLRPYPAIRLYPRMAPSGRLSLRPANA
jgi:hypothetical protein